ncbi:hypothetical protein FGIG_12571 [Fasciola gigantica]|uniref:Uncharacterized protein n=1 Tax=Fasciola gigantica TaxID=46835 RepID=A0A504YUX9_FASGI|nr:hypothetical protein FGIG_12571 [Fasciola gigantica]
MKSEKGSPSDAPSHLLTPQSVTPEDSVIVAVSINGDTRHILHDAVRPIPETADDINRDFQLDLVIHSALQWVEEKWLNSPDWQLINRTHAASHSPWRISVSCLQTESSFRQNSLAVPQWTSRNGSHEDCNPQLHSLAVHEDRDRGHCANVHDVK